MSKEKHNPENTNDAITEEVRRNAEKLGVDKEAERLITEATGGKSAEELTTKEVLENLMDDLILYVEDTDMKGLKNADLFKYIQTGDLHRISVVLEERAFTGDKRAEELMKRVDSEKFKSSSHEKKSEYADIAQKQYEKWRAERMG